MEQAFAVLYHTRQRPLVKGVLMSVGMVFLLTVFGGLMLVTTTLLGLVNQLPYLPSVLANATVAFLVQAAIGVLAGFLLYLCIYFVVPNRHQSWGKVWVGALFAGVLFEAISLLFPLYLRLTGASAAYGKTFGLLFLLMIYFYFLGIVTMVGAEVNSLLYPVPVDQPQGKESPVTAAQAPKPRPRPKPRHVRRSRIKGVLRLCRPLADRSSPPQVTRLLAG